MRRVQLIAGESENVFACVLVAFEIRLWSTDVVNAIKDSLKE